MRTVIVIVIAALASIAALPAAADVAAPNPCSLLTEKQVADLLGEPVEDGRAEKGRGVRLCDWLTVEEGAGGVEGSQLELSVFIHTSKQARTAFEEIVRDQENEVIDGVGDEAVADEMFPGLPVIARVGKRIIEVDVSNYDTSKWDRDPGAVAIEAAELVADDLAKGRDEPEPVEQPEEMFARFADDMPVPESFMSRTALGTEYNGGGYFGGDLTIDEVVAFYQEALADLGYEVDDPTTEDVDGVATTILRFSNEDRTGTIGISPNDDPPGVTLLSVFYEEVAA